MLITINRLTESAEGSCGGQFSRFDVMAITRFRDDLWSRCLARTAMVSSGQPLMNGGDGNSCSFVWLPCLPAGLMPLN